MPCRASAPLTSFEKQALKLAFVAVGLPAALRGATTGLAPVLDELELQLGVGLLALSLGAFGTLLLRRRREGRAFPLPVVVIFGSQVVWELLPSLRFVSHASWVGAVDTLWPAAIPFFHCAQYLGVVGWRARGVGAGQAVRPLFWYAGLVVGGLLLFRGTALLQGLAFDRPAMQLNLVVAVVNIHHFVIDGMIWRKRMPAPSARTALAAPPSIMPSAWQHLTPGAACATRAGLPRAGLTGLPGARTRRAVDFRLPREGGGRRRRCLHRGWILACALSSRAAAVPWPSIASASSSFFCRSSSSASASFESDGTRSSS